MIPSPYPDQARPYISESEAQSLFQRLDEIFHKIVNPVCPLMLIPCIGGIIIVIAAFTGLIGGFNEGWQYVFIPLIPFILFIGCLAFAKILLSKRKRDVTEAIEQWNRTEGVSKGIYFALGSDNCISPKDFWLGFFSGRIEDEGNSHIHTHTHTDVTIK